MQRQKRPFYIIGHNPNTIAEAREYLHNGANGLEPDIVHAHGCFYVSHEHRVSYEHVPTVEQYLRALKDLLIAENYNLAFMIWDMKDTDFNPTYFMGIVKENFSGGPCDGVAMVITHADDHGFLNRYRGYYPNVGVGVDESNIASSRLEEIFIAGAQKNFTYADGITTFLSKPGVYKNITGAQQLRNLHEPDSFAMIYTWVLSQEASMRRCLDLYIDGIMVDAGSVKRLKELINTSPYNSVYEFAENGYNPFTASPLPKYSLTIKTTGKLFAGTDARFLFTLTGASGESLQSLPFDASAAGALERGTNTCVILEGLDLGVIKSLTIEALTEGLAAGWLPEIILVTGSLLNEPVRFVFNDNKNENWITKKSGSVTKFPA